MLNMEFWDLKISDFLHDGIGSWVASFEYGIVSGTNINLGIKWD